MMTSARSTALRDRAMVPLRVIVGYGFLAHGMAKWMRGPAGFARLLDFVGVPFPLFTSWMVMLLEVFGGLALIAGVLVTLATIPMIVSMLVAMFTVHLRYGFSSVNTIGMSAAGPLFGPPGYEINLLYLTALTALALRGAGPLSIDSWWLRRDM